MLYQIQTKVQEENQLEEGYLAIAKEKTKSKIRKIIPVNSYEIQEVFLYKKIEVTNKIKQERTYKVKEQKIPRKILQTVEIDNQLKFKQEIEGVASKYQYEAIIKWEEEGEVYLRKVTLTRFIEVKTRNNQKRLKERNEHRNTNARVLAKVLRSIMKKCQINTDVR